MFRSLLRHFSTSEALPSTALSASQPTDPGAAEPLAHHSPAPRFRPTCWNTGQVQKLAGKKILWNEAYPGIYIRVDRRDRMGTSPKVISDNLNNIAASTEGHALLAGISAAHLRDPGIKVELRGVNRLASAGRYERPKKKQDGKQTSGMIFINPANLAMYFDVQQTIWHELHHAYLYAQLGPARLYKDFAQRAHDRSTAAEEEIYVAGIGNHLGKSPLGELRCSLLEGRFSFLLYGDNTGYDVPTPWERNSGDEAIFPLQEHETPALPSFFPKTSQNDQNKKEREADSRFFADQLILLESYRLQSTRQELNSAEFAPRITPSLQDKHRAQEIMFVEAIQLAKADRLGAAHRLAKTFPADMLSHLNISGVRHLEVDTVKRLIGTRYAQYVEARLADILLNSSMNSLLQAYHFTLERYSRLSNVKHVRGRGGQEELRSPSEYVRDIHAIFEEIWYNAMKPVARDTQAYRNLDFERNRFNVGAPKLAELFHYRLDRSERISEYMEVLARTPSSVFKQTA